MNKLVALAILCLMTVSGFSAKALSGFYFNQDLGVSYNGLGVALGTRVFYRIPLSDSPDILWSSTKIDIGLDNSLTPADDRLALYLNVEPIALFDVTVLAGGSFLYKWLGYGMTFVPAYDSAVTGTDFDALPQIDQAAWFLKITPRLKAQIGPVIIADALEVILLSAGSGSGYYYLRKEALVMKTSDGCLVNNTYLLYDFSNGFYAGLNYYILWHPVSRLGTQYAAAIGAYDWKLSPDLTLSFNLLVGWYTVDTYRQYNASFPYIAGSAGLSMKI